MKPYGRLNLFYVRCSTSEEVTSERLRLPVALLLAQALVAPVHAAELKARTIAAFERYERLTEARMAAEIRPFLRVDRLDAAARHAVLEKLRAGEVTIDRLETRDVGRKIDVPDGMIHHWAGTGFVPGVRLDRAVALLQDYNRHAQFYRPAVARSEILQRDGDRFRVFLRFFLKKVIAVTVNTESVAEFSRPGPDRAASRIRSTRVAEVENAGTPSERELPVGRDGGYLWRLNSYWRFLERDGGTYIDCESITLTRDIPFGFGWLVGPFVTSLPRETLMFTLETTQKTLLASQSR